MASTISNLVLEVGFVSVPVSVKAASESKDVSFGRASPDGNPIARIEVDKETGERIEGEVRKGVWEDEEFKEIEPSLIQEIEEATKLTSISIEHFVALDAVPWERVKGGYFLSPQKGTSTKALVLLHEALVKAKKAGVFKFVLRSRQKLGLVYAKHGGLFISTLAFADEFSRTKHDVALSHPDKLDRKMVAMAVELIEAKTTDAAILDTFEDDLIPLKQDLIARAVSGKELPKRKATAKPKLPAGDPLMAALKLSVENSKREKVKA